MRGWMGPRRGLELAVGAAVLLSAIPVMTDAEAPDLFLSNGDGIAGWQWLRDPGGGQYATWSFWGRDAGQPVTVTFGLLATDGVNGGPGVDARAWVTIGSIESGAAGPAIKGPSLLTFPNVSAPDDPVGYTTLGTVDILAEELSPTMDGLWVLVERRGPTGDVLPEHIAANRDAVTVEGLAAPPCDGPCPPAPDPSPSAAPSPPPA